MMRALTFLKYLFPNQRLMHHLGQHSLAYFREMNAVPHEVAAKALRASKTGILNSPADRTTQRIEAELYLRALHRSPI